MPAPLDIEITDDKLLTQMGVPKGGRRRQSRRQSRRRSRNRKSRRR